jgi:hypothetical protein
LDKYVIKNASAYTVVINCMSSFIDNVSISSIIVDYTGGRKGRERETCKGKIYLERIGREE